MKQDIAKMICYPPGLVACALLVDWTQFPPLFAIYLLAVAVLATDPALRTVPLAILVLAFLPLAALAIWLDSLALKLTLPILLGMLRVLRHDGHSPHRQLWKALRRLHARHATRT